MSESLAVQRFDGMSIDTYQGRFRGPFDCDATDASDVRLDDELYYLVRVRAVGAAVDETKGGDLRRTNVYQISDAVRVDNNVGFRLATVRNAELNLSQDLLTSISKPDVEDDGVLDDEDIEGVR